MAEVIEEEPETLCFRHGAKLTCDSKEYLIRPSAGDKNPRQVHRCYDAHTGGIM